MGLILSITVAVYICCCRGQRGQATDNSHKSKRRKRHAQSNQGASRTDKVRLDKLPNAAETKKMEEGQTFVDIREQNGKAASEDTGNFIMGPSADLAEREADNRIIGNDNDGFTKDNQIESGAYLRGGVDPADVAEAYMHDEYLKEASKSRRAQQLEVRKKAVKSTSNAKKQSSKRKDSNHNHGNKQRNSSKRKGSET